MRRGGRAIVLGLVLFLSVSCDSGEAEPPPGLDPAEEVEMVEIDPDESDDSYVWEIAYEVEGLPKVNVGHVTEQLLEDAARVGDDPEDYQCLGDGSGSAGCAVEDEGQPSIGGLNFGDDPDTAAWSWQFLPEGTVAVTFTDQDGETSWQMAHERLVIFPDTVPDDMDGNCPGCRFDAIDAEGEVIASVDIQSLSFLDG